MNLKEFARLRNLTLPKLKALCEELLGHVPNLLTAEQQERIDAELLAASQKVLPPSDHYEGGEITTSQEELPHVSQQVINIVGIKTLQKNLLLYLQLAKTALQAKKFEQDTLVFQAEQAVYSDLATYQQQTFHESLNRINQASGMTEWNGIRNHQPGPDDAEGATLQKEIVDLMEALGL